MSKNVSRELRREGANVVEGELSGGVYELLDKTLFSGYNSSTNRVYGRD
jgi:hypothetical protein